MRNLLPRSCIGHWSGNETGDIQDIDKIIDMLEQTPNKVHSHG